MNEVSIRRHTTDQTVWSGRVPVAHVKEDAVAHVKEDAAVKKCVFVLYMAVAKAHKVRLQISTIQDEYTQVL